MFHSSPLLPHQISEAKRPWYECKNATTPLQNVSQCSLSCVVTLWRLKTQRSKANEMKVTQLFFGRNSA